jgi:hypothetical protein
LLSDPLALLSEPDVPLEACDWLAGSCASPTDPTAWTGSLDRPSTPPDLTTAVERSLTTGTLL